MGDRYSVHVRDLCDYKNEPPKLVGDYSSLCNAHRTLFYYLKFMTRHRTKLCVLVANYLLGTNGVPSDTHMDHIRFLKVRKTVGS